MIWIINTLALNLTIVLLVELCLGSLFRIKGVRGFATVALINVLTNPSVVLCMLSVSAFFHAWEYGALAALETGVVLLEGFLFSKFKPFRVQKPYFVSLVLNMSSFLTGEILKIVI